MSRRFHEAVDRLFIAEDALSSPLVGRIAAALPDTPVTHFPAHDRRAAIAAAGTTHPRRALVLAPNRGRFLKPFPRHPWYEYNHMHNLLLGFNCYAACHYCFIHTYFDDAFPTMYTNESEMHDELRVFLTEHPDAWFSTGEFIDSLQLDAITRHTERIMDTMAEFPRAVFELRTKHSRVDHLPACPHDGVVFSFSINPDVISRRIEAGSADLANRLAAARRVLDLGYRLAFRIDPIIATDEYIDHYDDFVDRVQRVVSWREVSRVFLGVLRFDDALMDDFARGAASRKLLNAEYVRAPDGKYRLYRGARTAIYRRLSDAIRAQHRGAEIELVMEPDYVARAVGADTALSD